MAEMLIQSESLTSIADKIRVLSGTTGAMGLDAMATHVGEANTEVDNQVELLAQAVAALEGKTSGSEQVTPVISVSSNGLITATAGSKSTTHQLAFQAAKTITPSTASQIAVSSGYYTGGDITVNGDSNLVAGNIKSGVSIFGVSGTYAGSGGSSGDTSAEDSLVTRTVSTYMNDRVTTIGILAFYSCPSLTTASFPAATTIGNSAFYSCSKLTTVSFPIATSIGNYAFYRCFRLTTASFPKASIVYSGAFNNCYNLKSLYLTGSSLCKLSHSNAFSSTPIGGYSTSAGTYGSIYVPASLLNSYKTATNWAYFSSRFVGI